MTIGTGTTLRGKEEILFFIKPTKGIIFFSTLHNGREKVIHLNHAAKMQP